MIFRYEYFFHASYTISHCFIQDYIWSLCPYLQMLCFLDFCHQYQCLQSKLFQLLAVLIHCFTLHMFYMDKHIYIYIYVIHTHTHLKRSLNRIFTLIKYFFFGNKIYSFWVCLMPSDLDKHSYQCCIIIYSSDIPLYFLVLLFWISFC